jgi:hypothetical protein
LALLSISDEMFGMQDPDGKAILLNEPLENITLTSSALIIT